MNITLSPGVAVTADDIAQFDAQWTNPQQHGKALNQAYWWLYRRDPAGCWETGDHMSVLARMYELTRQTRYLDQLRDFIVHALLFRDDYHPGDFHNSGLDIPVLPVDEFRGRVMPAWGGKSVNSGGFHGTSETTTGKYGYPIAAFARIVAEDAALHVTYGTDAVRYANEMLKTALAFIPYFDFRQVDNFKEGYLTYPMGLQKLTPDVCESAYQKAIVGASQEEVEWYKRQRKNCNTAREVAGYPLAHNQNFLFAMLLIELWRALDSPFYQQSPDRSADAAPQIILIPLLISRLQRYFFNHLKTVEAGTSQEHFFWYGGDDVAPGVNQYPEDIHHGAVDILYIDVLSRSFERLNAYPASVGEPIPLDDSHLRRFANTFLLKIGSGGFHIGGVPDRPDFAGDVAGTPPDKNYNGDAGGWITLAVANADVYKVCHNVWMRTIDDGTQLYLNPTTHSLLLTNKHLAGRFRYYERTRAVGAPKAAGSPSGIVFPALGETKVVYRDTVGQVHELWQRGMESGTRNLTQLAGNVIRAWGDPKLYIATVSGMLVAVYLATDGHIYSFYWSNGNVGHCSLSRASAGAPTSAGNPVGYVQNDGTNIVIYRSGSHLHSLWWKGQDTPGNENITPDDAPKPIGDPAPYANPNVGENIVPYRDDQSHIHAIYWRGVESVEDDDLSTSPQAVGNAVPYYTAWNDVHQIYYRSYDGHIHEIRWQGQEAASNWDVIAATPGAPAAASDPAAFYSADTNTKHIFYRSADGHLHEIWWGNSTTHIDITLEAHAPAALDTPVAFTVKGPNIHHVIYRGTDGEIHEIRWA